MLESDLSKEALSDMSTLSFPFFPTASRPGQTSGDQELPTAPRGFNHHDPNPANLGRVSHRAWPVGQ